MVLRQDLAVLCRPMPSMSHAPHALQARAGDAIRGMQRGPAVPPASLLPLRNCACQCVRSPLHAVPWQCQQGCLQVSGRCPMLSNRPRCPSIIRDRPVWHQGRFERNALHKALRVACFIETASVGKVCCRFRRAALPLGYDAEMTCCVLCDRRFEELCRSYGTARPPGHGQAQGRGGRGAGTSPERCNAM